MSVSVTLISGGAWSGHSSLCDNIMPIHILGNGFYKLRERINKLKKEYDPSSYQLSGEISDIVFDTDKFDDLVQKNCPRNNSLNGVRYFR